MNVIELPVTDRADVAGFLRGLADEIDAEKFGAIGCLGVVLLGDTFEVFGVGVDSSGPSVGMLFHAATNVLSRDLEAHGRGAV